MPRGQRGAKSSNELACLYVYDPVSLLFVRQLLLLTAFGYSDVTRLTFVLRRRFRELVWIGLGLLGQAILGGKGSMPPPPVAKQEGTRSGLRTK